LGGGNVRVANPWRLDMELRRGGLID
jgi:hypothetical protein